MNGVFLFRFLLFLSIVCMGLVLFNVSPLRAASPLSFHCLLMIASTLFVIISICGGAWTRWFSNCIRLGLACCWLGDYFGPGNFIHGALWFVAAHGFFIIGFLWIGINPKRLFYSCIVFAALGSLNAAVILPSVSKKELWLVILYLGIISTMAILAGGSCARRRLYILTCSAASVFYLSDVILAVSRYLTNEFMSYLFIGYPVYYLACLLFAWSVYVDADDTILSINRNEENESIAE